MLSKRLLPLVVMVTLFAAVIFVGPVLAQELPIEYQPLGQLALDVAGIALVTGILIFSAKQSMPPAGTDWLFKQNPWLVNLSAFVISVGVALLGAWLNVMSFEARAVTEYVWKGFFSGAVATFGYEFQKNLGRDRQ